ncbi:MAG: hypothetical protein ACREB3_03540, partial [Burkholderiales bacterium]
TRQAIEQTGANSMSIQSEHFITYDLPFTDSGKCAHDEARAICENINRKYAEADYSENTWEAMQAELDELPDGLAELYGLAIATYSVELEEDAA